MNHRKMWQYITLINNWETSLPAPLHILHPSTGLWKGSTLVARNIPNHTLQHTNAETQWKLFMFYIFVLIASWLQERIEFNCNVFQCLSHEAIKTRLHLHGRTFDSQPQKFKLKIWLNLVYISLIICGKILCSNLFITER